MTVLIQLFVETPCCSNQYFGCFYTVDTRMAGQNIDSAEHFLSTLISIGP